LLALAQEQTGDKEPGDDEEDIDADEAAGDTGDASMEQDDEQDRYAAQAFDVRAEAVRSWIADPRRRSRPRLTLAATDRRSRRRATPIVRERWVPGL
jgi:hypothetical protein